MMKSKRLFSEAGMFRVGDDVAHYNFGKRVEVVFFEKTETWGCPAMFGMQTRVSWRDLRKKIMGKLRGEARAAARKEYLVRLELRTKYPPRGERHVDLTPKSASEAFG